MRLYVAKGYILGACGSQERIDPAAERRCEPFPMHQLPPTCHNWNPSKYFLRLDFCCGAQCSVVLSCISCCNCGVLRDDWIVQDNCKVLWTAASYETTVHQPRECLGGWQTMIYHDILLTAHKIKGFKCKKKVQPTLASFKIVAKIWAGYKLHNYCKCSRNTGITGICKQLFFYFPVNQLNTNKVTHSS